MSLNQPAEAARAVRRKKAVPPVRRSISICLSGGGYRATAFAAGALLAVLSSPAGSQVRSISSVSGGSIASAFFTDAVGSGPAEARRRAVALAKLVTSPHMKAEKLIRRAGVALALLAVVLVVKVFGFWYYSGTPSTLTEEELVKVGVLPVSVVVAIGSAFAVSASAIQSVIESMLHSVRSDNYRKSLAWALLQRTRSVNDGDTGDATHVYCATDISSGEHVYLSEREVHLVNEQPLKGAKLPLPDVIAASAGFPGFRPLTFTSDQIGIDPPSGGAVSHSKRSVTGVLARTLAGTLGLASVLLALAVFTLRCAGLIPGAYGLIISTAVITCALCLALWCAVLLKHQPGQLHLVDGGVCDNLGAAFAFLTNDSRYVGLEGLLFGQAGNTAEDSRPLVEKVVFVVDASKPLERVSHNATMVLAFIPFRLRVLGRTTIQLINNANVTARKRAVQYLLNLDSLRSGKVLSISDPPCDTFEGSDFWARVANDNQQVPTSLNALPVDQASQLMMHGHRLMEQALRAHSFEPPPVMKKKDFDSMFSSTAEGLVFKQLGEWSSGPAARRQRLARLIFPVWVFVALSLWMSVSITW